MRQCFFSCSDKDFAVKNFAGQTSLTRKERPIADSHSLPISCQCRPEAKHDKEMKGKNVYKIPTRIRTHDLLFTDEHSFENYRPISILSSVSKVFEKVMYSQIYEHFSSHNLFYNSQYGFRCQHSTEYACLELVDRIIQDMDIGKTPINVYMDLSKTFDSLDHKIYYLTNSVIMGSKTSHASQEVSSCYTNSELTQLSHCEVTGRDST